MGQAKRNKTNKKYIRFIQLYRYFNKTVSEYDMNCAAR